MSKVSSGDSKNTLYCSFCGKSQHEVQKLIAGPEVFVCETPGSTSEVTEKTRNYFCGRTSM